MRCSGGSAGPGTLCTHQRAHTRGGPSGCQNRHHSRDEYSCRGASGPGPPPQPLILQQKMQRYFQPKNYHARTGPSHPHKYTNFGVANRAQREKAGVYHAEYVIQTIFPGGNAILPASNTSRLRTLALNAHATPFTVQRFFWACEFPTMRINQSRKLLRILQDDK